MVLESFISPFKAEKKPWELFFIGFLYSTVALFLSNWIFREQASFLMVFLTVMAAIPLLYNTFKIEEKKDSLLKGERTLLKEHSKVISFLMFMFLGFVIGYVTWYLLLPASFVNDSFHVQTQTIQSIRAQISGGYSSLNTFKFILLNNLKVMVFCILFSFLYGVGAIFILTWNASVIAAAIGNYIRSNLSLYAHKIGIEKVATYSQIISLGLSRYMIHGIPEIAAYVIAGFAGGIISVAVIRERFGTKNFEKVILDASDMILIAVALLIVATVLEVYVTPLLF